MSRITSIFLISAVFSLLAVSCTSNEIGNSKDVNPESIYFDYRVWGDEESQDITVKLQYRFGGQNGRVAFMPVRISE